MIFDNLLYGCVIAFLFALLVHFMFRNSQHYPIIRRIADICSFAALLTFIFAGKVYELPESANTLKFWALVIGSFFAFINVLRMITQKKI